MHVQADCGNHLIRLIDVSSATVTTLAGNAGITGYEDGVGSAASFNWPNNVAVNDAGTVAIVVSETRLMDDGVYNI
jgi:DNA-binding beta-propeller fold protein YncE